MSGITALFSHRSVQKKEIKAMLGSIRHRGPNGTGVELFLGSMDALWFAGLGHVSLGVNESDHQATQPMRYRDRYWISVDGSLYNSVELRQKLRARGYEFGTESDSGIILAAYAEWGVACLEYLNGMFAFIIIDNIQHRVFVARDRFGIKPLYVYQDEHCIAFASEVKAFFSLSRIRQNIKPNETECHRFIEKGMAEWRNETLFTGVKRFPFAHYIEVSIDRLLSADWLAEPYWSFSRQCERCEFSAEMAALHIAEYKTLLHSAVQMHSQADNAVGVALAGGLDSASIAALMPAGLAKPEEDDKIKPQTFSAVLAQNKGFQYEKTLEEDDYIELVEKHLKAESMNIKLDWKETSKELERFIWALDSPPDISTLSHWYTFRAAAENNIAVILNGQGADELLAGDYNTQAQDSKSSYKDIFTHTLLRFFSVETVDNIVGFMGDSQEVQQDLSKQLRYRFSHQLVNDLHYLDRASMAWSVETRMPFLDVNLVEYVFKLSDDYKVHEGWGKWLARKAMENDLPEQITWQKEHKTWPSPEKEWLSGALKYWLIDKIQASHFLKELGYGDHVTTRIAHGESITRLMRELNLALWHKLFFEEKEEQKRELGRQTIKKMLSFNPREDSYTRQRRQREHVVVTG